MADPIVETMRRAQRVIDSATAASYQQALAVEAGLRPRGNWFTGVCEDMASEAVRGVRVDVVPATGPRPQLTRGMVSPFAEDYPSLVGEWVAEQVRILRAEQERIDRNLAMLLWGIHL